MSGPVLGAAGFLLLLACGRLYAARGALPLPAALALAHLTGSAAVAAGITCGLAISDGFSLWWGLGGLAGVAALGLARRHPDLEDDPTAPPEPLSRGEWLLSGLIAVGLATALVRVLLLPLDWDGWAFWQLKAKALTIGTLKELLTDPRYQYGHADYPLLVPTHTWWLCAGRFDEKTAQIGGSLFLLDLLALFHYEARARVSRTWALAGCLAIVSWPAVMKHTASGFADLPLTAYIFAAITLASRGDTWRMAPCLAGVLLTKNEGILALAPVALAALLPAAPGRTWRWSALLVSAIVAAFTAGAWNLVGRRWSLYSLMLDPGHWTPGFLTLLPERLRVVAAGFAAQAVLVGPQYPGWGLLWPLAGGGFVLSIRRRLWETAPFWLLVVVHAAGVGAGFLLTAVDAEGYLLTSLDRLALQVAPVALLAGMLAFQSEGRVQVGVAVPITGRAAPPPRSPSALPPG